MLIERIEKKNDSYQILETLKRNRTKRTKAGKIFTEGVIPINILLEQGYSIDTVVCAGRKGLSSWAQELIVKSGPRRVVELRAELMGELSDKENSSEVIVIADQRGLGLDNLDKSLLKRVVILDRPSNQGNLGAIIRSCDAFAIDAILISGHSVDPYDPKTISSSRGTVFKIPLVKVGSNKQLTQWNSEMRKNHNFIFYGTSAKGKQDIYNGLEREKNLGLIIGNETTGMNEFLFDESDEVLTIPMKGAATSLNIACAASILLYEITR